MAKISPKDNWLKLSGGGRPEYVPFFSMVGEEYLGEAPTKRAGYPIFGDSRDASGNGYDMWGVKYVATTETARASLPEPGNFLLKDITKWRDVIKRPKVEENIDWEAMAKKCIEGAGVDRTKSALTVGPGTQPFQQLMAFMGHTEGLIALYEEPEEVKALLNFIADFYEPYLVKLLDYYKPDYWSLVDDTCAELDPFFSVEMYRDIFKPIYIRFSKVARERGLPILFHNCGRCEDFVEDMVDFGVTYVEPCQESNDWLKVQEKFGDKLSIIGGYDWGRRIPKTYPEFSEEELRQSVRDTIDKYSKNGGYAFFAWPISYLGDQTIDKVKLIIRDEAHFYGRKVYGYQD